MPQYQTKGRRVLRVLRHILVPILILMAITSSYSLPFANVSYSMQVISNETEELATQVVTEEIQLDVMAYGVCKRQSGEQLQKIDDNKLALESAGNFVGSNEVAYHNRLQLILATDFLKVANFLCGSNVLIDPQTNTWTAASWVVTLLMLPAGMFSLLSIATHVSTVIYTKSYDRFRPNCAVTLFSNASTTMISMASFLYISLTGHERTSVAEFGSGFIILLTVIVLILCGHIIGSILTSCKPEPRQDDRLPDTEVKIKEGSVII